MRERESECERECEREGERVPKLDERPHSNQTCAPPNLFFPFDLNSVAMVVTIGLLRPIRLVI